MADAQSFHDCFQIVVERVKPVRDKVKRKAHRERWWMHGELRPGLYAAIKNLSHVTLHAFTSKYIAFSVLPNDCRFAAPMNVFAFSDWGRFATLQSNLHIVWALKYCSTMEGRIRYTRTDVFETFPFPEKLQCLESVGGDYHKHRRSVMISREEGLTDTYNRFHDPQEKSEDIVNLRALHVLMDRAVAVAYGWTDLELGHAFRETKQGVRYTISEPARRIVLDRLLALNHQQHEEEVTTGLHDRKANAQGPNGNRGGKSKQAIAGSTPALLE